MSTIVLSAVIIIGTFGFMIFMKKRLNTQYAHLKAGALAQRLGMQLVEGNPEHNLATHSVLPSVQNTGSAGGFLKQMAATQVGGTLGEFRLRMIGRPYGSDAELVLYAREDLEVGYTQNTTTTWSDLRFTFHVRSNVTPFELALREQMTGLETRANEQPMPKQRFGDAALDKRYVIESFDQNLPRHLAGVLAPLAQLAYVHVVGAGNQISFVMTPTAVCSSAMSLEQIVHVLASITAVFEGKPMPQPMAAPVAA
jgi:hypothetical protein